MIVGDEILGGKVYMFANENHVLILTVIDSNNSHLIRNDSNNSYLKMRVTFIFLK